MARKTFGLIVAVPWISLRRSWNSSVTKLVRSFLGPPFCPLRKITCLAELATKTPDPLDISYCKDKAEINLSARVGQKIKDQFWPKSTSRKNYLFGTILRADNINIISLKQGEGSKKDALLSTILQGNCHQITILRLTIVSAQSLSTSKQVIKSAKKSFTDGETDDKERSKFQIH